MLEKLTDTSRSLTLELKNLNEVERIRLEDEMINRAAELMQEEIDLLKDKKNELKEIYDLQVAEIDKVIDGLKAQWKEEDALRDAEKERLADLDFEKKQQQKLLDIEKLRADLVKARLTLENTMNEKNIQQLRQTEDGRFQYFYVADEDAVQRAQDAVDKLEEQIAGKQTDYDDSALDYARQKSEKLIQLERDRQLQELEDQKLFLKEQYEADVESLDDRITKLQDFIKNMKKELEVSKNWQINTWGDLLSRLEWLETQSFSNRLNELGYFITQWNQEIENMKAPAPDDADGSHRAGLRYVPFDGYVAELHEGERVLTAKESEAYLKAQPVLERIGSDGRVMRYMDINFLDTAPFSNFVSAMEKIDFTPYADAASLNYAVSQRYLGAYDFDKLQNAVNNNTQTVHKSNDMHIQSLALNLQAINGFDDFVKQLKNLVSITDQMKNEY